MRWPRWLFWWRRRRDERILVVVLNLWKQYDDQNSDIVNAFDVADLSWFRQVMIYVPSSRDFPDAPDNGFVRRVVSVCREKGLKLIWCRGLWPSWWKTEAERDEWLLARARDPVGFEHYTDAILRLLDEARELGAVATALDAEMYGASPLVGLIKQFTSARVAGLMEAAISVATYHVGRVDYVFPSASSRQQGYQWITRELGLIHCDQRTYYAHPPELIEMPTHAPPDQRRLVHRWGCNVEASGAPANPDRPDVDLRLTPAEVQSIDLRKVRRVYPECRGIWVYADPKALPEVMRTWGRTAKGNKAERAGAV